MSDMSDKPLYKSATGFVYAGPWDREVNGKKVRDFMMSVPRDILNNEGDVKVRVTIWDGMADKDVKEGDYVALNGKWEVFPKQDESGEFIDTYSISANKFTVLGNGLGTDTKRSPSPGDVPNKKRVVNTGIDF